jgi:hypothetical protein
MGKLRLDINSTYVEKSMKGNYGIVDIVFNGTTLASAKQLSATVESLEYDVGIDNTSNTLKIKLLNSVGYDANLDGDFSDAEDQVMQAIVSTLSYSIDNTTYTTLLPQAATSYTVPGGLYAGNVLILTESVTQFTSYDLTGELLFNDDGIVNSTQISGVKLKVLENGSVQDLVNEKTYDADGNEIGAP